MKLQNRSATPYLFVAVCLVTLGIARSAYEQMLAYTPAKIVPSTMRHILPLIAVVLAAGAAIFWSRLEARKVRSATVNQPLLKAAVQNVFTDAATTTGVQPLPEVALVRPELGCEPRVSYLHGMARILVPLNFAVLAGGAPRTLQAALLHELGHVVSGDSWRAAAADMLLVFCTMFVAVAAATSLAGWGLSLYAMVSEFGFGRTPWDSFLLQGLQLGTWLVGYLVILWFAYCGFLQAREMYADRFAAQHGYRAELSQFFRDAIVTGKLRRNWFAFHPSAHERIRAQSVTFFELGFGNLLRASAIAAAATTLIPNASASPFSNAGSFAFTVAGMVALSMLVFVLGGMFGYAMHATNMPRRVAIKLGGRSCAAIMIGVVCGKLLTQLLLGLEPQAPWGITFREQVGWAAAIGVLACTMFICASVAAGLAAKNEAATASARWAWSALGWLLGLSVWGAAAFIFLLWIDPPLFRELVQELSPERRLSEPELTAIASAWGSSGAAILAAFAVLMVWGRRGRPRQDAQSAGLRPLVLPVALFAAISALPFAVGNAAYPIGFQLATARALRVGCRVGNSPVLRSEVERIRQELSKRFAEVAPPLAAASTDELQDDACDESDWEPYPIARKALLALGLVQDYRVEISAPDGRELVARYVDPSRGESEFRIGDSSTSSALTAVNLILLEFDPRVLAFYEARHGDRVLAEQLLQALANAGDSRQRAWARHELGLLQLQSKDQHGAMLSFQRAVELDAANPAYALSLARLVRNTDCPRTRDLMLIGMSAPEPLAADVMGAASCMSPQDGLALLYRWRDQFAENGAYLAFLGEYARMLGKNSLANAYFRKALSVAERRPGEDIGCAKLFLALARDERCVKGTPCTPPLALSTARENWCWAEYARAWGRSDLANEHYKHAAEMDPAYAVQRN